MYWLDGSQMPLTAASSLPPPADSLPDPPAFDANQDIGDEVAVKPLDQKVHCIALAVSQGSGNGIR